LLVGRFVIDGMSSPVRDEIMVDVRMWKFEDMEMWEKSYEGNHNRAKGL